jgi:hypothetical protein
MAEEKPPINASEAQPPDILASSSETNQEKDGKYDSQPEGKASFGDYAVWLHSYRGTYRRLTSHWHLANILLCN